MEGSRRMRACVKVAWVCLIREPRWDGRLVCKSQIESVSST